jgi:hypothetical protein
MKWINRSRIVPISITVIMTLLILTDVHAGPSVTVANTNAAIVVNTAANPVWGSNFKDHDGCVCLTGTSIVSVVSSTNAPVIVRDVDNAQQPYQETMGAFVTGVNGTTAGFATVPAGKRLVVEFVSVTGTVPTGQKVTSASIEDHHPNLFHVLTVTPQGTQPVLGTDIFVASQQIRMYFEAGKSPSVSMGRDDTTGQMGIQATITGYFINVP